MIFIFKNHYFMVSFSGKKARTFDLDAIFEQTRRTAIERSKKVLGKSVAGLAGG